VREFYRNNLLLYHELNVGKETSRQRRCKGKIETEPRSRHFKVEIKLAHHDRF